MAELVYVMCALTSILCAVLLLRANLARPRPLLFWSAVCFSLLALNNVLLFIDLVVAVGTDLSGARSAVALSGLGSLLYGLVAGADR